MIRTSGSDASSASTSRDPFGAGLAVDLVPLRQQPPAEPEILVAEDHARARAAGRERRHQPGRPAADHQHIAMREGLLVVVGILRAGRAAEARGAADQRLVQRLPEASAAT